MKKCLVLLISCLISAFSHSAPLPAAEVFQASTKPIDANTFALTIQIKPGYFLYSDRIKVTAPTNEKLQLGPVRLPETMKNIDKLGVSTNVYRNKVIIPLSVLSDQPGKMQLNLSYQGCSDTGFCYAPEHKEILLTFANNKALTQVNMRTENKQTLVQTPISSQQESISQVFSNHNWAMILLIFYGFGLLLSFTPCILPMVPILSGIIVGHGKNISTRKAFFLSLSYVLSMSLTYAAIGAFVARLGANLQISMQSPWSIGLFSLIFILLGLSMFGFYEFKLPKSWQAKIGNTSRNQPGGHYLGAAMMGCLSTLILSPCVTAPLIGVLTYIAQTKNVLLGCLTLFVLSLGMGTPLLLIGTSAGKWLPETGSWMNSIKALFGVIFMGVAINLLSRILPHGLSMGLWASLLILTGIYCGALTYSPSGREKFHQGIGLIILGYGFLILIGASMGAINPLQPLKVAKAASVHSNPTSKQQTLKTLNQAIKAAHGKPVMLDFYADWCSTCKALERTTLADPRVRKQLKQFVVIKVDVSKNNVSDQEILHYFDVVAPPTFIFFDAEGKQQPELKLVGDFSVDELLRVLKQIRG